MSAYYSYYSSSYYYYDYDYDDYYCEQAKDLRDSGVSKGHANFTILRINYQNYR